MSATTETASDTQPRNSFAAFWRRLTSISIKNAFAVRSRQPAQASASCASDMARSSAMEWDGADIDAYLESVERRIAESPYGRWQALPQGAQADLSPTAYLVAVDAPRLIELVRRSKVFRPVFVSGAPGSRKYVGTGTYLGANPYLVADMERQQPPVNTGLK